MFSISPLPKKSVEAEAAATNMSVKGMAIVLAVMLCATIAQGFPMFKGGRCLCIDPGVKAVRVADIDKVSVMYPSNKCDKTEVIVTMKTTKRKRCLNPRSKQANIIIKLVERTKLLKLQNI